jgi:hypothetical protein
LRGPLQITFCQAVRDSSQKQFEVMPSAGECNRLLNQNAIVLDELGYLPFAHDGGALLFHLVSKLYERVSLPFVGTPGHTSKPVHVPSMPDDADVNRPRRIVDFVHNAVVANADSP